jgi:hypothetical protein
VKLDVLLTGLETRGPNWTPPRPAAGWPKGGATRVLYRMRKEQRERAALEVLVALRRGGCTLSELWQDGPTHYRGHPYAVDARRRRAEVAAITFTRIAPGDGLDSGDNDRGALKWVRDGAFRSLGINDRGGRRGGIEPGYAQERGPWGVRITIELAS